MTSSIHSAPRVSWLLCTHRDDPLLHRAIASCLRQTMADFELLLIANGHEQERLVETLSRRYGADPRVRIVGTSVSLLNFSLTLGLHIARASYIARMDGDDVSAPDRLERQLAFMEANPSVTVLGSNYSLIDASGKICGHVALPGTDESIRKALRYRNPICHPSAMLRRQPILELGGYLGGQHAEDYDLWLRVMQRKSWQFSNLPDELLSYNVDPKGAARRSRSAYANVAAAQLRNFLLTFDPRFAVGAALSAVKSITIAHHA